MKLIISLVSLVLALASTAASPESNPQIAALFQKTNTNGTFVVFNFNEDSYTVHNPARSKTRYIPASTFKIANSLIGLSVGAVSDVDEVLPYGGQPQFVKRWEKDMGLRDAIQISNVPIYKELARRIGLERMAENVIELDYGNANIGSVVDSFWLEGPLEINAMEQAQFLVRLAKGELHFSDSVQTSVRNIIKLESGEDWTLYGKTGWANGIGWWVGWVEKNGNVYSFAINIDMTDIKDAPKRIELGKRSLEILGILN